LDASPSVVGVSCPKIGLHIYSLKKCVNMKKKTKNLGFKHPAEFGWDDRKAIIEEYLQTGISKKDIWRKFTGQEQEKGQLLRWMRQLGFDIPPNRTIFASKSFMAKKEKEDSLKEIELREKITQLEKALADSELQATAYKTMIEVAEEELKINIRKKSVTKQSIK